MNAFAAETSAWKLKGLAQDIAHEAQSAALAIKRGAQGQEEAIARVASCRKLIAQADRVLAELAAAVKRENANV